MLKYTFKRFFRAPLPAISVLLFAVILSIVICGLEKSNEDEHLKYEETYRTVPVTFTVTNLSGTKYTDLDIGDFFVDAFSENGDLAPFVSDLQMVMTHALDGTYSGSAIHCITSTALSPELSPENGTTVTWNEGYGEDIFGTSEYLCLVPQSMTTQTDEETGEVYVELYFSQWVDIGNTREYTCRLTVAGTYAGGDGKTVYAPWFLGEEIRVALQKFISVQAIRATLTSNDDLDELRQAAEKWFAEPNPLGEKTPWPQGKFYAEEYYPHALDINDDLLQRATTTLQNSINTNRICAVLILCLSAAAGLLIGFLMVRSRKREIALMRTMGTPDRSIYSSFLLEQMLCFGLGIILGGAYNTWQPISQLGILAGVFFVGLTAALLICLRKNLITTIKEDD